MSMGEVLKEAKLMQYNLKFCGMGLLPIVLHTEADAARTFCHKRGVGRMKHLDGRHCWLQEELEKGNFKVNVLIESSMRVICSLTVPLQKSCESSFP